MEREENKYDEDLYELNQLEEKPNGENGGDKVSFNIDNM